jgi:hypothetical protein
VNGYAGLSEIFFKGLSDLKHNNIAVDRIASALREAQIDLPMLVDRAKELNEIDARRPWLIEDASIIAERLAS